MNFKANLQILGKFLPQIHKKLYLREFQNSLNLEQGKSFIIQKQNSTQKIYLMGKHQLVVWQKMQVLQMTLVKAHLKITQIIQINYSSQMLLENHLRIIEVIPLLIPMNNNNYKSIN